MVRILTDNHHLYIIKRAKIEGIEYQTSGRITRRMQIFLSYKVAEIDKILLLELVTYVLSTAVFYLYVHA